ncbi:unnamed protein product [Cuscuta campestris]|uniref:MULE transposase domain-containing protein n=1 Tax=Cuscuta campestris TaxID=132261 RepID=A0A484MGA3_9ASTE|nr:unnamed protein product [Cuscuta campestris]
MKLMGIESDRLWEIFFQKAIPLGLLEVYIDSDRAGGDEAGPSRRVDRDRLRRETIADEVINNPDSDDDEEYIPLDDDIDTEEHWIREMEAEAGERGISYKSNGPLAIGTVVDVVYATEPPNLNATPEETSRFKYAFLAFAAAIHGLQYCTPVVTVDGTHLYGKYNGHLLLAVAMNGNREIFPLAYAVVDRETCESWTWFFAFLFRGLSAHNKPVLFLTDILESLTPIVTFQNYRPN